MSNCDNIKESLQKYKPTKHQKSFKKIKISKKRCYVR